MTLRTILIASSAIVLSTAAAMSGAEAATHAVRHHAGMGQQVAAHTKAKHASSRAVRATHGGDAQNSTVDQLNAQSLSAARGAAAPAPAPATPAAQ